MRRPRVVTDDHDRRRPHATWRLRMADTITEQVIVTSADGTLAGQAYDAHVMDPKTVAAAIGEFVL